MEAKDVKTLMEAYASVYEGYGKKKKGDCVSKSEKGDHNCAKKVCSEQWGEGETIFGQHAVPDENGFVSHYDVQFEHGIVENVSVEDMDILTMESHNEHVEHEGETISEMGGMLGAVKKVVKAVVGPADQSPEAEAARMGKRRGPAPKAGSKPAMRSEDADLFDIIKGHLIDEGFADTEEAAHSIMVSMSEGWKQSIVEGYGSMIGSAVSKAAGALKNRMQSDTKRTGNINLPNSAPVPNSAAIAASNASKRTTNINLP
ncbi:MAG: hypothetical protein CMA57_00225 [Euryarchaeota archaeon]|nr:hypothetical protein [Euryarchaeota archaeon]|tara:strand:+ start:120 stop:896 length:777 start_codon:yes stop_codon:yes gene_type:complete